MRTVWHQGQANINRLLDNAPPETRTTRTPTCNLPYEIVEMIIAHIARDFDALKTCSLTCRSWYTAAVPHLHRTLTLTKRGKLKPLSRLHRLGLMPLIKEIRVEQKGAWFMPHAFSRRDLGYFSAFANVRTLKFEYFEIPRFMPGIDSYFGHFSPTVQSIMLLQPFCTPRQLSLFLTLFPNLDDITIQRISTSPPNTTILDTEFFPFSTPRLRGRLALLGFDSVETWTHLIALGGDLRFRYMDLCRVGGCAPVLFEACAETLETLRFYATDPLVGE
jgi:hypothetical protein